MNAQSKIEVENVYQKLNRAREMFHTTELRKSGRNTFANYSYFELGDFLLPALRIFNEVGLCALPISFTADVATMTIVRVDDPSDCITFTSPMGSAALKGCHEVQNIGAVETYQRRYLWVTALEIVEHDALDATNGKDAGSARDNSEGRQVSPTGPGNEPQGRQRVARDKLDGPFTSWTALERAVKSFDRELRSCGDSETLEAFLLTDDVKALRAQLERDAPQYLTGGDNLPEEFEPLNGLVSRLRYDFEQLETANRMVGYGRT